MVAEAKPLTATKAFYLSWQLAQLEQASQKAQSSEGEQDPTKDEKVSSNDREASGESKGNRSGSE